MKVGVLSDIHGNATALEGTLAFLKKEKVERLFILGDLIGYYYEVKKAIELLADWDCEYIKGNHEALFEEANKSEQVLAHYQSKYGSSFKIANRDLSHDQKDFLTSLVEKKELLIGVFKILLCHGSPWSIDEYIYPNTANEIIEQCTTLGKDIIFHGHTHYPSIISRGGLLLINPGSVGQSRVTGGISNFGIWNTGNNCYTPCSLRYDIADLLEQVQKNDPDIPYLTNVLKR